MNFPAVSNSGWRLRALVHKPRLLVCDEPTSAIDARTGHAIMTLIREVALEPNRVTIVVTHDQRVLEFGDRVVTLEDGRVAADQLGEAKNPGNRMQF